MGTTEILRRICLLFANKIKISESSSKQPTQLNLLADKVSKTRFLSCFKLNYLQKTRWTGFFKISMFDLECANKFLIEF